MLRLTLLCLWLCSAVAAQTQYGSTAKPGAIAPARTGCPWLTAGSAAHALGGDVSVTAKVSNIGEGSCTFTRQQGSTDSLDVLVGKAGLSACPSDSTSLRGIGNEALTCRPHSSGGEAVEMITSRVRDLHFNVTLTTRGSKSPAKPGDPQNDALEQIAEQVAGNLY